MDNKQKEVTAEDIKKPLENSNKIIKLALLIWISSWLYFRIKYGWSTESVNAEEKAFQLISKFMFVIGIGSFMEAIRKGLKCIIQVMEN